MIWIVPIAGERFAQNRIERFLHAPTLDFSQNSNVLLLSGKANVRWSDMPATQVKLDHRNKTLCWIFDFGHGKKCFRMCHEAIANC